jgi:dTDP-4-amino-4,6-dideoxygalactose transaminase
MTPGSDTEPRVGIIPLMRPQLPTRQQLEPYLREIDENRWYTNFGPLIQRLEERLADHFGIPKTKAAIVANGTTALSAALIAVGAKPGTKCLLPSWTFVASASAVWAANLEPHFVDVDPGTLQPDPAALRERSDLANVGAVMIVSPFGSPVDTAVWDQFSADTGIPVIIDGAASFDTVASMPSARVGTSPMMISLHATKVFGIGEGGLVLSTSESTIHRVRQVCNFGIWGSSEGQVLGYNGKVSEYHGVVGLAALEAWPARRVQLESRTQRYVDELKRLDGVKLLPGYGEGWVSTYCTVYVPGNIFAIADRMQYMGIETRRWWQDGVHALAAYRRFTRDELPVTADITAHTLSLPFYHDITDEEIARVVGCLESALHAPV